MERLFAPAALQGGAENEDAFGVRADEFGAHGFVVHRLVSAVFSVGAEAGPPGFERTQRLLERLLQIPADRHRFADRLHLSAEGRIGHREFLEGEARDFGHDVVERRFEAARRAAGDVVAEFVERVADREQRRDLCDRKAGRLRGERARPRYARIHFDDDAPSGFGVHGPLHVRAAGLDADGGHDRERVVAHFLVFAVGQRLNRRDGDRVAGVDAHRIEIFDRTDDDRIAGLVAHDLHLELLPAEQRLFDQDFGVQAGVESARDDLLELLRIVRDAAARSAERKAGADDERPAPDGRCDRLRFGHRVSRTGARQVEPDAEHALLEELAVLGAADRFGGRTDEFDLVTFEDAALVELHGEVQRGLSAEGRQQCVGAFAPDDFVQDVGGQRFDVGSVREFRVGHDRGRIAVHEHDFEVFALQRLAGLHAGIVELAPLADHDRAGADQHDFSDVVASGHISFLSFSAAPPRPARRRAGGAAGAGI